MNKPDSLRNHLIEHIQWLRENPDKLIMFVDAGKLQSTAAPALSFEFAYTLNILIKDLPSDAAINIFALVLDWVRFNQVELLLNENLMRDGCKIEADILNNQTMDLSINLQVSERIGVHDQDGQRTIVCYPEPDNDPFEGCDTWSLYIKDQLVIPAGQEAAPNDG